MGERVRVGWREPHFGGWAVVRVMMGRRMERVGRIVVVDGGSWGKAVVLSLDWCQSTTFLGLLY